VSGANDFGEQSECAADWTDWEQSTNQEEEDQIFVESLPVIGKVPLRNNP